MFMKRYHTLVVAAALDDCDATTLRHAARFAQTAESKTVYVAHVAPSFDLSAEAVAEHPELVLPIDEEIEERLKAAVEAQPGLFPEATQVHYVARQGAPVPELLRLAAQKAADLLFVGRQPREERDSRLSASVVGLVRKAPCSVFIVPAGVEPQYTRILVPVDFSDHAREALDVAVAVAATCPGATITVLHVYGVPTGYGKTGRSYEEFARSMQQLAEKNWDRFSRGVNFRSVPSSIRHELSEQVSKTILAVADETDAHLIVLGSHGRTRPAGVLLGHVADSVCSQTTRPLLCVKNKGEVVNFLHALLQLFELE